MIAPQVIIGRSFGIRAPRPDFTTVDKAPGHAPALEIYLLISPAMWTSFQERLHSASQPAFVVLLCFTYPPLTALHVNSQATKAHCLIRLSQVGLDMPIMQLGQCTEYSLSASSDQCGWSLQGPEAILSYGSPFFLSHFEA